MLSTRPLTPYKILRLVKDEEMGRLVCRELRLVMEENGVLEVEGDWRAAASFDPKTPLWSGIRLDERSEWFGQINRLVRSSPMVAP